MKIFALIEYYYKLDLKGKNILFKDFIDLRDEDRIGYLNEKWKEELSKSIKKEEENIIKIKAEDANPEVLETLEKKSLDDEKDPVMKGLKLIEKYVKFGEILNSYREKKDVRALFSIKDKVFLTNCLIDFFDKEFSYIFSSNKVDFNVILVNGNRLDMRRDLSDTQYRLNGILERVNEYIKVIREIRKLDNDNFMSVHERSSRSNQYSIQRSQISRTMRKESREFYEEFSKKFLLMVSDKDGRIIRNADAVLEFDKKIDGEKFTDGKKVIEAVEDAYFFCSALNFLLLDGDLGGVSILLEEPVYLNLQFKDEI